MNKFLAVVFATVGGLLVGGCLGLIAGQAPVFHWEMAGLVVTLAAGVAGAIAGAAGAASGKVSVGVAVGLLLGGAGFALLSVGQQHPPALTFWGTVLTAAAAGVAGALDGFISRRGGVTPRAR